MSGNTAGGKKAAETNKKRYGENFYAEIGRKGGQNGNTGGFYANRELARIAGAKGGSISRRGPSKKVQEEDAIEPKERLSATSDFVDHTYKKKFKWPWAK